MTALSESYASTEERTDYSQIKMLGVTVEIHFITANCYAFTCKTAMCYYSSRVLTPYKAENTLKLVTGIQLFVWLLPIFQVLSCLSEISFSCSFHQCPSNKYQFWDLSFWMCQCIPFLPCSLDLLLQNKGVLFFRAGNSPEVNQEVSLILHWMKRMIAVLKVSEKYLPSCRGNWATSVISSCEWQKRINLFLRSVFFLGVSVR